MKSYKQKQIEKDKIEAELVIHQRLKQDCQIRTGKTKQLGANIGIASDFNCQNFIRFGFICSKKSCEEE